MKLNKEDLKKSGYESCEYCGSKKFRFYGVIIDENGDVDYNKCNFDCECVECGCPNGIISELDLTEEEYKDFKEKEKEGKITSFPQNYEERYKENEN